MSKKSLFSKVVSVELDVEKAKKAFLESLAPEALQKAFPSTANLGTLSSGKPIKREQIAAASQAVPVAQNPDGSQVLIDPRTGKPIMLTTDDPDDLEIETPEDFNKLQQLAAIAQQTTANPQQQQQPNRQAQANQQNAAQQKARQASSGFQQGNRLQEEFSLDDILSGLGDLFNPNEESKKDKKKIASVYAGPDELEESDEEDDTKEEPVKEPEVKTVDQVSDNLTVINPTDALAALGDDFWAPPGEENQDEYQKLVAQTQQRIGAVAAPVQIEPVAAKPVPNMRQYVKTSMPGRGMVGDVTGDDFDDILGMDSPISLKLTLELGR